jgi:biopolymer transport protein ExbD
MYGGTNIGINGIRATLLQATQNDKRPLVIQADKQVTTERLVQVIDQAKLAGIEQINLASEVE